MWYLCGMIRVLILAAALAVGGGVWAAAQDGDQEAQFKALLAAESKDRKSVV